MHYRQGAKWFNGGFMGGVPFWIGSLYQVRKFLCGSGSVDAIMLSCPRFRALRLADIFASRSRNQRR